MDMVLVLINLIMASALVFAIYITQQDRDFFCQKLWRRVWKS
jgi:hypothetical protein